MSNSGKFKQLDMFSGQDIRHVSELRPGDCLAVYENGKRIGTATLFYLLPESPNELAIRFAGCYTTKLVCVENIKKLY